MKQFGLNCNFEKLMFHKKCILTFNTMVDLRTSSPLYMRPTTGIEHAFTHTISAFVWLMRQSGAAVEHNDVILTLGLISKQHVPETPISNVSMIHIMQL